jgi:[acyl-carrier-protein] S-malonyltransferase
MAYLSMPQRLTQRLSDAALAFRGYNVTNLGRTAELLAHPAYGSVVENCLRSASTVAADILHRPVDLIGRVRAGDETTLDSYGDAVALVLAVESAQLELLERFFGIDYRGARFSFGFSLGEIAALVAGGVLDLESALRIPLALADDCVALAHDVTLGVLFTRSRELVVSDVQRLCLEVNQQGQGVVGISAYLAPNTLLVMGQRDTLDRLVARARDEFNVRVHLRKNDHRWPPLHTPIVWQRQIPNRAAEQMHTLPLKLAPPEPRIYSLATGGFSYSSVSAREVLAQWVDRPQRLWDAVYESLSSGVSTIIHVGPAPNIVPATFQRLSADVSSQMSESRSLRALSAAVRRQWLRRLLPQRAALLRAPFIEQVILEDWLLANTPAPRKSSGELPAAALPAR